MKGLFSIIDIGAAGLSAQRKKLNTVAQNIANVETTRTPEGTPYKRKKVVFAEDSKRASFLESLNDSIKRLVRTHSKHIQNEGQTAGKQGKLPFVAGAEEVVEPNSFKIVYDPSHPDADENGNVLMPDINVVSEMVDMLSASRAYEANISVVRAAKDMAKEAMDI
jgi:flagellar basal-body rod protein FlgC